MAACAKAGHTGPRTMADTFPNDDCAECLDDDSRQVAREYVEEHGRIEDDDGA